MIISGLISVQEFSHNLLSIPSGFPSVLAVFLQSYVED